MASIPQKELRNELDAVLRRAEQGERITVTVAGRPVAELGPVSRRRWVSGSGQLLPHGASADLPAFPGDFADPYA